MVQIVKNNPDRVFKTTYDVGVSTIREVEILLEVMGKKYVTMSFGRGLTKISLSNTELIFQDGVLMYAEFLTDYDDMKDVKLYFTDTENDDERYEPLKLYVTELEIDVSTADFGYTLTDKIDAFDSEAEDLLREDLDFLQKKYKIMLTILDDLLTVRFYVKSIYKGGI
jgi:hypothetical protein